jgi:hypothetical protein
MEAVPAWGMAEAAAVFFFWELRRTKKKTRPAMRAMPIMGPATAPAIQALDLLPPLLGEEEGVGVVVMTTPGAGAVVAVVV